MFHSEQWPLSRKSHVAVTADHGTLYDVFSWMGLPNDEFKCESILPSNLTNYFVQQIKIGNDMKSWITLGLTVLFFCIPFRYIFRDVNEKVSLKWLLFEEFNSEKTSSVIFVMQNFGYALILTGVISKLFRDYEFFDQLFLPVIIQILTFVVIVMLYPLYVKSKRKQ